MGSRAAWDWPKSKRAADTRDALKTILTVLDGLPSRDVVDEDLLDVGCEEVCSVVKRRRHKRCKQRNVHSNGCGRVEICGLSKQLKTINESLKVDKRVKSDTRQRKEDEKSLFLMN